jgi:hypothetical protein
VSQFLNLYSGNGEDQNLLVCNTKWFDREASEFRIKLLARFSTLKIEAVGAVDRVTYARQSTSRDIPQHGYLPTYKVTITPP